MSAGGGGGGGEESGVSRWVEAGKKWLVGVALASSIVGGGGLLSPGAMPAFAGSPEETKEVGICLLSECRGALASCLLNPKCFANIICLQTCNGRPDEGYCQIRCGDLFENEAVGKFNACAVSKKNCVKQRQDDGSWPVPPIESQAKSFNPKLMEGQWYISAGLNPAFDTFDCQVHFFNSPKPGKLVGKLNWRIKEPDGEFFTRDVVQTFDQDPKNPAHLVNKDNEYLHYRDDWYILDSEPNSHVLVVYRGSNDAWDGYGGGTLYTKDKTVPPGIVERVKAKSEAAGIKWERWQYNDNTCKPQTSETAELLREKYAKKLILSEGKQLQEQLTAVRGYAAQEVTEVESSTLEKLEDLKQEYEVEVEQLGTDLAAAFETELRLFEEGLAGEANTVLNEATSIITGTSNSRD
ncbi:violaxanthin de-epoxidase, chloroplast precursor [Ectocarpus siliculosus]|uniref:Violaxanthin de-epoxidase, chloroplast n=1 Tax=Ectocarpus siliculosus TaxID=2880 RepID=D7FY70_ECTSI|nr:violaxanthin de-epoxidase, chloroplast precursor [Ectocarpus siliculosus]|eukprot:CBJ26509.1 violaxanthin de-epoxidase, chloroplast precursor [Ectocarpus siliculosus]